MLDKDIQMHLMGIGIKNLPPENLQIIMKNITDPMFEFFENENDLAKMYLVAQILEDQVILAIKEKIIEGFKGMNPESSKKEGLH